MRTSLIPAPEARELPDDEAWRALFDDFGLLRDEPTQPMPLALEPMPADEFTERVRRVIGGAK